MKTKKVLIVRLGAIGDVVHTTIIADAIKNKHPDWQIDFLTTKYFEKLLENHPSIDNVLFWEEEDKKAKGFLRFAKELFNNHYDYFFSPTLSLRTFLLSLLIFPKKKSFKKNFDGPWVENYFLMAKNLIKDLEIPEKLSLGLSQNSINKINNEISKYPKPHFVIAPGREIDNGRQGRLWNIESWKRLNNLILDNYGGTIFVIGSPNEKETHNILANNNVIIRTGEYSIEDSIALFSKADLVIAIDSGPVHMASAFNVKTLALLGSTNPKHIKPYGKNGYYVSADYDCLYCWKKKCKHLKDGEKYTPCMEKLTPNKVFEKIKKIFE